MTRGWISGPGYLFGLALAIPAAAEEMYKTVVLAPPSSEAGESVVPTAVLKVAPGSGGDPGKALENLPGVARAGGGSGDLSVWGASPAETRVFVDGIEIPALYHPGGLRSTLPSGAIQSISLVAGGYGPERGRGLGGIVSLETRGPPSEGYAANLDINPMDASVLLGKAFDRGGGALVSGRVGYLDRVLGPAIPGDVRALFPIPAYQDFLAKASLPIREGENIDLVILGSADGETITTDPGSPSARRERRQDRSFSRVGLRYRRVDASGVGFTFSPAVGREHSFRQVTTGPGSATEDYATTLVLASGRIIVPMNEEWTLEVGIDTKLAWSTVARSGTPTMPAREGDVVTFGQPVPDVSTRDDWRASLGNFAPWMAVEYVRGPWRVAPSLRLDGFLIGTDRVAPANGISPRVGNARWSWSPAPRLSVSHQTRSWLKEQVAIGLYHQPPDPAELGPTSGSPFLGIAHAAHAVVGLEVIAADWLSFHPTLFVRRMWNLAARNPAPSPALAHALLSDGTGYARGAQVLAMFSPPGRMGGWLSYTLSRSDRRDSPTASTRLFDRDQTHVVSAVASVRLAGFLLGVRYRYATGSPRTPVTGGYLDAASGRYQPIFGEQNSIRLPAFQSLDLRVDRKTTVRGLVLHPYLEILNATNHRNAEEYSYDEQFQTRGSLTGFPLLALVGISVVY